jgi:hypothetical protein
MASSDLNVLLDMGFDKERAEIAVKRTGGRRSSHPTFPTILADSWQYKEHYSGSRTTKRNQLKRFELRKLNRRLEELATRTTSTPNLRHSRKEKSLGR